MRSEGTRSSVAELPLDALAVDRESSEPIQQQIYNALRDRILRRALVPGLRLPSSRALAKDLMVSRNTIMAAYDQLISEGYLASRERFRPQVVDLPIVPASAARGENALQVESNLSRGARTMFRYQPPTAYTGGVALRSNAPDVAHFPFKTWSRLTTKSYQRKGDELFGYNHPDGYPPLREAIASYLQAYRGVRCQPNQIVITSGGQGALDLLARLLLNEGDYVWMEEPGFHGAQGVFVAAGARLAPLRVDAAGWQLAAVPHEPIRLIYVTPSCQQPLGVTMLMDQRLRLLEIAERKNAWIIEDDFDSEHRLSGTSVPAMQGADTTGRTIYAGTFAKTLFPAVRIGFLVLPETMRADVLPALVVSGHFACLPQQAVLCDFIVEGHFARYLRRMRRLYGGRREHFLALVDRHLGRWLEPFKSDVGIQITFQLKADLDDQLIARRANERQLNVTPLSTRFVHGNATRGFVLGFAGLDEPAMDDHLARFAQVVTEVAAELTQPQVDDPDHRALQHKGEHTTT